MFRYALSPRWVPWHVFCLVAVGLLIAAGVWQWNVAMGSVNDAGEPEVSIRNLVYGIQWWIFAVFGVWFWWRYLRDQRDADQAELQAEVRSAADQQIDGSSEADIDLTRISLDGSASERRQRARMRHDDDVADLREQNGGNSE